ncbi:hypothetical protein EKD04_007265 [Chloroflexales bacterium ZM16-3]|nr:hypothetical protein [Chloroflexales bacterium ZM16-3]
MFETFKNIIRTDLDEFLATRKMQRAIDLSQLTGQHFNHSEYPMYFTGKLDARMVLVHLNPKHRNSDALTYTGSLWLPNFETYFTYHQRFGQTLYGPTAPRTHKSRFDHKQIRFLTPFGIIPFVEERSRDDRFTNLERVCDEKLQLELIPYSSDKFSPKGFTPTILQPHIERLLDVISACPRDYVLFCGQIFEPFFHESITDTHEFKLPKNDGSMTQNKARFSNLRFTRSGKIIRAGLAHTFAQQGIPMAAYGRQCKALYASQ